MSTRHYPPTKDAPKCDYTDKEIRIKPLLWFFILTFAFCILTMVAIRFWLNDMEAQSVDRMDGKPEFAVVRQLPPTNMPLLQIRPKDELAVHHAHEQSLINNGTAWADAGKTKARIPVTNAMQILVATPGAFPVRTK